MDASLKSLLKKHAIDYTLVPSAVVPNDTGQIIAIENYYPDDCESIDLSISLSYATSNWAPKCWLSKNIPNTNASKPLPYQNYTKFEYNQINYHPYSINTNQYQLLDIFKICGGLYKFVKTSNVINNE